MENPPDYRVMVDLSEGDLETRLKRLERDVYSAYGGEPADIGTITAPTITGDAIETERLTVTDAAEGTGTPDTIVKSAADLESPDCSRAPSGR